MPQTCSEKINKMTNQENLQELQKAIGRCMVYCSHVKGIQGLTNNLKDPDLMKSPIQEGIEISLSAFRTRLGIMEEFEKKYHLTNSLMDYRSPEGKTFREYYVSNLSDVINEFGLAHKNLCLQEAYNQK